VPPIAPTSPGKVIYHFPRVGASYDSYLSRSGAPSGKEKEPPQRGKRDEPGSTAGDSSDAPRGRLMDANQSCSLVGGLRRPSHWRLVVDSRRLPSLSEELVN